MGATGHLSARQGTKVKVHLRDGSTFLAKYKQRHARSVEFDDGRKVPTAQIKTISYYKPTRQKPPITGEHKP